MIMAECNNFVIIFTIKYLFKLCSNHVSTEVILVLDLWNVVLNFNDIFVGRKEEIDKSLALLGEAMMKLPKLYSVDLSNNAVSVGGCKSL